MKQSSGTVIITMAGGSTRFKNAGIVDNKWLLPINDTTMFSMAVRSCDQFFKTHKFVFATHKLTLAERYVLKSEISKLGLTDYSICEINRATNGQGSTVMTVLEECVAGPIIIQNIDTYQKLPKIQLNTLENFDGLIPIFEVNSDHWSFVEFTDIYLTNIQEKQRISNWATTGMYFFGSAQLFKKYFELTYPNETSETFIAPIYKTMINDEKQIQIVKLEERDVVCMGTPKEYEQARSLFKETALFR